MKHNILKMLLPAIVLVAMFNSCSEEPFVEYQSGLTQKINNPDIQIGTPVIAFQGGIPSYDLKFDVINSVRKVTKVNLYSTYTDAKTGKIASEVLLKSYPIEDKAKVEVKDALTYADLKKGVTIDGAALPDDDKTLAVGSGWKIRFEGETAQGPVNFNGSVVASVLSVYAGLYKVIEAKYYRINALTADWTGETRFIGSVDENTFSHPDYWGNFAWAGKAFNFDINFSDNTIDVPILVDGAIFSGLGPRSCKTDSGAFKNVPCEGSNVLIPDPANPTGASGKHRIKLTYGYYAANGEREFYEVLEKI